MTLQCSKSIDPRIPLIHSIFSEPGSVVCPQFIKLRPILMRKRILQCFVGIRQHKKEFSGKDRNQKREGDGIQYRREWKKHLRSEVRLQPTGVLETWDGRVRWEDAHKTSCNSLRAPIRLHTQKENYTMTFTWIILCKWIP